jgi:PIN domain nuclease of toxin-antitoxin system
VAGTLTVAPGSDLTEPMDFEWNGVTADIFTCSSFLPQLLHKDRSDRILVGAAKGHDPTIVTRDRSIYT